MIPSVLRSARSELALSSSDGVGCAASPVRPESEPASAAARAAGTRAALSHRGRPRSADAPLGPWNDGAEPPPQQPRYLPSFSPVTNGSHAAALKFCGDMSALGSREAAVLAPDPIHLADGFGAELRAASHRPPRPSATRASDRADAAVVASADVSRCKRSHCV
jgi:hypothetical protein